MAELSRQYIKERIDHLRELAREKREEEAQQPFINKTLPLEITVKEVFNPEEKIVNLAGEELPF